MLHTLGCQRVMIEYRDALRQRCGRRGAQTRVHDDFLEHVLRHRSSCAQESRR